MKYHIAHWLRVWVWGAKALAIPIIVALGAALCGLWLMLALMWLLGWGFSGPLWLACTLPFLPLGMPAAARRLAQLVRDEPPPSEYEVIDRQIRAEPDR